MKVVFVLSAIVAVALSAPQSDRDAYVVRSELDNIGVDGYSYAYQTSNGIAQQESGQLQRAGSPDEAIAVRGQYSYTGPDGVQYVINYVADENGYQPEGAHLPK